MSEKLVTVAEFSDYIEAEMAKQWLEDEGITAFLTGRHGGAYIGVPGIARITLQTPESQADEAKKILEAGRRLEESQEGEEDLPEDWDEDADEEPGEDLEQE